MTTIFQLEAFSDDAEYPRSSNTAESMHVIVVYQNVERDTTRCSYVEGRHAILDVSYIQRGHAMVQASCSYRSRFAGISDKFLNTCKLNSSSVLTVTLSCIQLAPDTGDIWAHDSCTNRCGASCNTPKRPLRSHRRHELTLSIPCHSL
jgi:hypothetical protein